MIFLENFLLQLYKSIYNTPYYSLLDLMWEKCPQENIGEAYERFKNEWFNNLSIEYNENKKRTEIFNLVLYIEKNIIPEILKSFSWNQDSDAALSQNQRYLEKREKELFDKIKKYKSTWISMIEKYFKESKDDKYILNDCKKNGIKDIKRYYKEVMDMVANWVKDDNLLLSDFHYLDDLQPNQIKVILETEPAYVFLQLLKADEKLAEHFDIYKTTVYKQYSAKNGGLIPYILLQPDAIFRASPIKILNSDIIEGTNIIDLEYTDSIRDINTIISVPLEQKNEALKTDFRADRDMIEHGKYELAMLVSIFQICREQLETSGLITFNLRQISDLWGQVPNTSSYQRMHQALWFLHLNSYTVTIKNTQYSFHIINNIAEPLRNSNKEKEYTIEIDRVLRQQILGGSYIELTSADITNFKYELTPILYKLLVIDRSERLTLIKSKHPNIQELSNKYVKEYTYNILSQRTFLDGKPYIRKNKIKNALDEIKQKNDIIDSYIEVNDRIFITFKR